MRSGSSARSTRSGGSAQGWKPGKAVTEEEFLAAVKNFENAPMNGAHTTKESEARR